MKRIIKIGQAFLILTRVNISLLVTFSAAIGFLISGIEINFATFLTLISGVFILSAGSCGLNQYQERELDQKMERTRKRPIPSGVLLPQQAFAISSVFIIFGFIILLTINPIAAFLGIANVLFYNGMYTPLKVKTPLSIVPGAVVGAIPPIIGWSAAGLSIAHPTILFVALFMFLWQFPHFWLLLIVYSAEYEKAGFSTLSRYLNKSQLKYLVYYITLLTCLFVMLYPVFGLKSSGLFFAVMVVLNLGFLAILHFLLLKNSRKDAVPKAFRLINMYMAGMLVIFLVNQISQ